MGVQQKAQRPQSNDENMDSTGINAESVVAGMVAPLQALRELLLWPVMYATEAASLGLRVLVLSTSLSADALFTLFPTASSFFLFSVYWV